jgi:hypothetical protein
MKRASLRRRRSEAEIRAIVAGYENGNQSREVYSKAHGLAVTTLDYYRRRLRPASAALVEVDLQSAAPTDGGTGTVAVVLANGRRIEIRWADLARVPDHSQPLRAFLCWLEEA